MGRGRFKGKPKGRRQLSTPEEMVSGHSTRPLTIRQAEAVVNVEEDEQEQCGDEITEEMEKHKGTEGIVEIDDNPNLLKAKVLKAKNTDVGKTTELSRREREEIEKQKPREPFMRLQEQGKAKKDSGQSAYLVFLTSFQEHQEQGNTEQAKKDLDRLALIRQQRAEAAKKREQEKAAKAAKNTAIPN